MNPGLTWMMYNDNDIVKYFLYIIMITWYTYTLFAQAMVRMRLVISCSWAGFTCWWLYHNPASGKFYWPLYQVVGGKWQDMMGTTNLGRIWRYPVLFRHINYSNFLLFSFWNPLEQVWLLAMATRSWKGGRGAENWLELHGSLWCKVVPLSWLIWLWIIHFDGNCKVIAFIVVGYQRVSWLATMKLCAAKAIRTQTCVISSSAELFWVALFYFVCQHVIHIWPAS